MRARRAAAANRFPHWLRPMPYPNAQLFPRLTLAASSRPGAERLLIGFPAGTPRGVPAPQPRKPRLWLCLGALAQRTGFTGMLRHRNLLLGIAIILRVVATVVSCCHCQHLGTGTRTTGHHCLLPTLLCGSESDPAPLCWDYHAPSGYAMTCARCIPPYAASAGEKQFRGMG